MPAERSPLWQRLSPVVEPTSDELQRIRVGVDQRLRERAARRRWLRVIPGLLVGLGILWWWLLAGRTSPVVPEPGTRGFDLPPAHASASSVSAEMPAAPRIVAPELLPAPLLVAVPRHRRPAIASPRPAVVPEADDPETALLGRALNQLRREHNPQGALSVLKTYRQEFPAGLLRPESLLVEAESLVALGSHQELVDLLTPATVSGVQRSTELSLLRAEALAHLGRCREAMPVFSSLLSTTFEDEPTRDSRLAERALFGRALCRARVGQLQAARHDLELEVTQFPEEAGKARQTLESLQ